MKTLGWLVALLFAAGVACGAQEPVAGAGQEPVATLKIGTRIVGVSAVVLDAKGHPVTGLTKDDFVLKQDGKEQEIRYFSQDSDLPLTLALMVDTSGSMRTFIQTEIAASQRFFPAMLTHPADRAALISFDSDVLQLQPMTNQVGSLEASLPYLDEPHAPIAGSTPHGGTLLYEAVVLGSQVELGKERGRRAMVIITDGEDNGSRVNLEQAIASAQRADIVIYSILYSLHQEDAYLRPNTPMHVSGDSRGRDALNALSNATGGRVFTVTNTMPLDRIYAEIADDMRLQYQIGYTPPESAAGTYHKLELKPRAKHLMVQARQGYYTPKQ